MPLRDQGTWAPRLIAPAGLLARKPPGASWEAAAAFPVPALTAEQGAPWVVPRRVVGYAMADHLRTELVADALGNAVAARNPAPGVIFHSDMAV